MALKVVVIILMTFNQFAFGNIIELIYLMCGHDYICNTTGMDNVVVPLKSYLDIGLCPICSCDRSCNLAGNCCPDVYLDFPGQECMETVFLDSSQYNVTSIYPMITECRDRANETEKTMCSEERSIINRINLPPVTSVWSKLTYANKYCAHCHSQLNYTEWILSVSCFRLTDFNFLSTYEEVIEHADDHDCVIKHEPRPDLDVKNCSFSENVVYHTCNMTGQWNDFNFDVKTGCESAYFLNYKIFKNIFCYMCNPNRQVNTPLIDICNATGVWHPYDASLERACLQNGISTRRLPYKNVFCLLCNRNNTSNQSLQDVNGVMYLRPTSYPYYDYRFTQLRYNMAFYVNILEKSANQTETTTSQTKKIQNITSLLMNFYANKAESGKLCDSSLLPRDLYSVINSTGQDCDCTPDSLYSSCPDFAIKHETYKVRNVLQRGFYGKDNAEEFYLTTSSCFENSDDVKKSASRCKSSKAIDIFNLLPTKMSGVLYKNLDCLVCNAYTELGENAALDQIAENTAFQNGITIPVSLRILCLRHYVDTNRFLTLHDIIKEASASKCRISFIKLKSEIYGEPSYDWYEKEYGETITHKCNVSGNWITYDSDVQLACENYNNFELNSVRFELYKNVFCAICNTNTANGINVSVCDKTKLKYSDELQTGCDLLPASGSYLPYKNVFCHCCNTRCKYFTTYLSPIDDCSLEPFTCSCLGSGCVVPTDIPGVKFRNLFTIHQHNGEIGNAACSKDQIYDMTTKSCRDIFCFPGKYLIEDMCLPLFSYTRNLRYTINFIIDKYNNGQTSVGSTIRGIENNMPFWWRHTLTNHLNISLDISILSVRLHSTLPCFHQLPMGNRTLFKAAINFIITSLVDRLYLEKSLLNLQGKRVKFELDKEPRSKRSSARNCKNEYIGSGNVHGNTTCQLFSSFENCNLRLARYRSTFLATPVVCQFVQYAPYEYTYDSKNDKVFIKPLGAVFSSGNFHISRSTNRASSVRVCVADIKPYNTSAMVQKSAFEMTVDVINVICTCVSILCLLLTFFVYSCFDQLRTLPGKMNMCLILSLFMAQICLQFGTIWTHRPIVCKVFGVILHVFWLSTFACMNVCSFHMFKVFSKMEVYDKSSDGVKFWKYTSYAFGVPVCIVIANIIVHYVMNDGRNLGYGGRMCFISGVMSKILSFIVPVALICFINIGMFVHTANTIHRRPNVRSTRNARNDFVVYVKLFSLTGVTWIVQMIDALLPLSVLTILVTLLAGLQGLFIFLSYVCNKGVFDMIKPFLNIMTEQQNAEVKMEEISSKRTAKKLSSDKST